MTQLASMGGDTAADMEGAVGGQSIPPQPYELGDVTGVLDAEQLRRLDQPPLGEVRQRPHCQALARAGLPSRTSCWMSPLGCATT